MNPAIMRNCVALALRRCDSFVFQYTEGMAWFEPGNVSQEWKDAIASGKADAAAAGRLVDAICGFTDVAAGTGVAIEGTHDGVGCGSGKWVVDGTGPGGLALCARFAGAAATSGTFVLPGGRWLKAVMLCADAPVDVTVSDDSVATKRNPSCRISLAANVPCNLVTGWTYPGQTVSINVSAAGPRLVVDDLRYLSTLAVPSPPANVRIVGP